MFHCLGPHASIARCLGSTPGQETNNSQDKCPSPPKKKLLKMKFNFPGSSVSKESACNAGDPSSIPGSGRSPEEGIGYPLQYSWASLGAQLIQNPSAILLKTWAQSLGWEDSPGGRHGKLLQYSCLENPHRQRCLVGYSP